MPLGILVPVVAVLAAVAMAAEMAVANGWLWP
jgi:hypothetical protein